MNTKSLFARIGVACALCLAAPAAAVDPVEAHPAAMAGRYDGSQSELAAALELGADGRFRYVLSYGALDERAEGRWIADKDGILLTSDPVVPPRFELVPGRSWAAPRLSILLDVPPGVSRQYFTAHVTMAGDRIVSRQLGADGLMLKLGPKDRALAVAMELDIYGVRGAPVILTRSRGGEVHFRFVPNDLGKVAFDRTQLRLESGGLLFERHGRIVRFRRISGGS